MKSKLKKTENSIFLVITTLFIFGFLIISNAGFTGLAIWFGTNATMGEWGNLVAPVNNTVILDTFSVNFTFNVTAAGLHNKSKITDETVLNLQFELNGTDYSGNNKNATILPIGLTSNITNATGIIGYGLKSKGVGNYIRVKNNIMNWSSSDFTLSAWIYPLTAGKYIMYSEANSDAYAWKLLYHTNARISFNVQNETGTSGLANRVINSANNVCPLNSWCYVVARFNRSSASIFTNGIYKGQVRHNFTYMRNSAGLYIGHSDAYAGKWNGSLDEIIIFNRSLTSGEISNIYNETLQDSGRDIKNCSLFLNDNNAGWIRNSTNTTGITEGINYTFNVNFSEENHNIYWKVGCYDDLGAQANSSAFYLSLSRALVINLQSPENNSYSASSYVNFTYNVTDSGGNNVDNCSIYLLKNNIWERNDTDTSITQGINQTFNRTIEKRINPSWKVGCYNNESISSNSSVNSLILNYLPVINSVEAYTHANPIKNISALWSFESITLDERGVNDGYIVGDPESTTGKVGNAVLLDGVDDTIKVVDDISLSFNGNMSLECWVKLNSTTGNQIILSTNRYVLVISSGKINFSKYNGWDVITDDVEIVNNTWYYVAATYDRNNVKVYKNGVLKKTEAHVDNIADSKIFYIGSHNNTAGFLNGSLDEVIKYNKLLSSADVRFNYYQYNRTNTSTLQSISVTLDSITSQDNDTIKYIYNWYKNNVSDLILNLPFEAVNNGSEQNFTKDYSSAKKHGKPSMNSYTLECQGSGNTSSCSGWNSTAGYDENGAYMFDGKADYISVTAPKLNATHNFTIMARVYRASINTSYIAWHGTSSDTFSWKLGSTSSNKFNCQVLNSSCTAMSCMSSVTSTNSYSRNRWHHIACTYNGNRTRLYVDGKEDGNAAGRWNVRQTNTFRISYDDAYSQTYFNGTIDEFMIWNRSLNADEILAIYRNQTYTIRASVTTTGDNWKAEVTANDGLVDSNSFNTSEIKILGVSFEVDSDNPVNNTRTSKQTIHLNYNASDYDGDSVSSCSLFLNYGSNWVINQTDNSIAVNTGNSFTVKSDYRDIKWKVGCYQDGIQRNTSIQNLSLQSHFMPNLTNVINDTSEILGYMVETFIYNGNWSKLPFDVGLLYSSLTGSNGKNVPAIAEALRNGKSIALDHYYNLWTGVNTSNISVLDLIYDVSAQTKFFQNLNSSVAVFMKNFSNFTGQLYFSMFEEYPTIRGFVEVNYDPIPARYLRYNQTMYNEIGMYMTNWSTLNTYQVRLQKKWFAQKATKALNLINEYVKNESDGEIKVLLSTYHAGWSWIDFTTLDFFDGIWMDVYDANAMGQYPAYVRSTKTVFPDSSPFYMMVCGYNYQNIVDSVDEEIAEVMHSYLAGADGMSFYGWYYADDNLTQADYNATNHKFMKVFSSVNKVNASSNKILLITYNRDDYAKGYLHLIKYDYLPYDWWMRNASIVNLSKYDLVWLYIDTSSSPRDIGITNETVDKINDYIEDGGDMIIQGQANFSVDYYYGSDVDPLIFYQNVSFAGNSTYYVAKTLTTELDNVLNINFRESVSSTLYKPYYWWMWNVTDDNSNIHRIIKDPDGKKNIYYALVQNIGNSSILFWSPNAYAYTRGKLFNITTNLIKAFADYNGVNLDIGEDIYNTSLKNNYEATSPSLRVRNVGFVDANLTSSTGYRINQFDMLTFTNRTYANDSIIIKPVRNYTYFFEFNNFGIYGNSSFEMALVQYNNQTLNITSVSSYPYNKIEVHNNIGPTYITNASSYNRSQSWDSSSKKLVFDINHSFGNTKVTSMVNFENISDSYIEYLDSGVFVIAMNYSNASNIISITVNGTGNNKKIGIKFNKPSLEVYDSNTKVVTVNNNNVESTASSYTAGYNSNTEVLMLTVPSFSKKIFYIRPYTPQVTTVEETKGVSAGGSSGGASESGRGSSMITESTATVTGNLYSIPYVVPGETILLINNPILSFISILLNTNREMREVIVNVNEDNNIGVEKPDARVYRYITVSTTNLEDSALNKAVIKFKVQKGWGKEITLQKYEDVWKKLETKKTGEDEYFEYYEAISHGFTIFAITKPAITADLKEGIREIARAATKKEEISKKELWLYAIIPIILISFISLLLLFYIIKEIKKHKKLSISVFLVCLALIVLLVPFSDRVLYWAILPMSLLVIVCLALGYFVWKIFKRKMEELQKLKKIKEKLKVQNNKGQYRIIIPKDLVQFIRGKHNINLTFALDDSNHIIVKKIKK